MWRQAHYRPHLLEVAILSKRAYGESNSFFARFKASSVPQSHAVASLKRVLVQAEELPDPSGELIGLFPRTVTRNAMDVGTRLRRRCRWWSALRYQTLKTSVIGPMAADVRIPFRWNRGKSKVR
jgi:hypothetical protein